MEHIGTILVLVVAVVTAQCGRMFLFYQILYMPLSSVLEGKLENQRTLIDRQTLLVGTVEIRLLWE